MNKTTIVLNEKYTNQPQILLNAVAHLAQGLGKQLSDEAGGRFVNYRDVDQNVYPPISWWPVIALRGNRSKMWAFHDALAQAKLPRGVFLDSMIEGGSQAQLDRTGALSRADLGLIAVGGFGPLDAINPMTARFSLWHPPVKEGIV